MGCSTYREAIRLLISKGIPYKVGKKHTMFYPTEGGMFSLPDKSMTMTKKTRSVLDKVLAGSPMTRQGRGKE